MSGVGRGVGAGAGTDAGTGGGDGTDKDANTKFQKPEFALCSTKL